MIFFQKAVTWKFPLRSPSPCFIGRQSAHYRKLSVGAIWCFIHPAAHWHIHAAPFHAMPYVSRHNLFIVTGDYGWGRKQEECFKQKWIHANDIRTLCTRGKNRFQLTGTIHTLPHHFLKANLIRAHNVCGHGRSLEPYSSNSEDLRWLCNYFVCVVIPNLSPFTDKRWGGYCQWWGDEDEHLLQHNLSNYLLYKPSRWGDVVIDLQSVSIHR